MKELQLEVGKGGKLKTSYDYHIKIGRTNTGYTVQAGEQKLSSCERLFIGKTPDGKEVITTYSSKGTKIYLVTETGLLLDRSMQVSPELLEKVQYRSVDFAPYPLMGMVNQYSIYFDNDRGNFFVVNSFAKTLTADEYPRYETYEQILETYKEKNIDIYSKDIKTRINKLKKTFINFNNLYEKVKNINIEELDDEIIFDLAVGRQTHKKLFSTYRDEFISEAITEEEFKNLSNKGYSEITASSYDILCKSFPQELDNFAQIITSNSEKLQKEAINHLKNKYPIDFEIFEKCIRQVSINDVSSSARKEITARRPLTKQIYSGILQAAMKKSGNISDYYEAIANFNAIYPEESEKLWNICLELLPNLCDEYFNEKEKLLKKN